MDCPAKTFLCKHVFFKTTQKRDATQAHAEQGRYGGRYGGRRGGGWIHTRRMRIHSAAGDSARRRRRTIEPFLANAPPGLAWPAGAMNLQLSFLQ